MTRETQTIKVIAKREDKGICLFFPEASARKGFILSWVEVGQHSEASIEYFHGLKKPGPDMAERAIRLYERTYSCSCERVFKQSATQRNKAWADT
jgi:hypothetical protein